VRVDLGRAHGRPLRRSSSSASMTRKGPSTRSGSAASITPCCAAWRCRPGA